MHLIKKKIAHKYNFVGIETWPHLGGGWVKKKKIRKKERKKARKKEEGWVKGPARVINNSFVCVSVRDFFFIYLFIYFLADVR